MISSLRTMLNDKLGKLEQSPGEIEMRMVQKIYLNLCHNYNVNIERRIRNKLFRKLQQNIWDVNEAKQRK